MLKNYLSSLPTASHWNGQREAPEAALSDASPDAAVDGTVAISSRFAPAPNDMLSWYWSGSSTTASFQILHENTPKPFE